MALALALAHGLCAWFPFVDPLGRAQPEGFWVYACICPTSDDYPLQKCISGIWTRDGRWSTNSFLGCGLWDILAGIGTNLQIFFRQQGITRKGIKIGSNCWIGSKVTVLDGVTVGNGCVIAAGAVLTKSFPDHVVIGGVPAKILKEI